MANVLILFFVSVVLLNSATAAPKACDLTTAEKQINFACTEITKLNLAQLKDTKSEFLYRTLLYDSCGLNQVAIYRQAPPNIAVLFPFLPWQNGIRSMNSYGDAYDILFLKNLAEKANTKSVTKISADTNINETPIRTHFIGKLCKLNDSTNLILYTGLLEPHTGYFVSPSYLSFDSSAIPMIRKFEASMPNIDKLSLYNEFAKILDPSADTLARMLNVPKNIVLAELQARHRLNADTSNLKPISFWEMYASFKVQIQQSPLIRLHKKINFLQTQNSSLEFLNDEITNIKNNLEHIEHNRIEKQKPQKALVILNLPLDYLTFGVSILALILSIYLIFATTRKR